MGENYCKNVQTLHAFFLLTSIKLEHKSSKLYHVCFRTIFFKKIEHHISFSPGLGFGTVALGAGSQFWLRPFCSLKGPSSKARLTSLDLNAQTALPGKAFSPVVNTPYTRGSDVVSRLTKEEVDWTKKHEDDE